MGRSRREFIRNFFGQEKAAAFETEPGPLGWLVELWQDSGQCRVEVGMSGVVLLGLGWPEIAAWIEGAGEHDLAPVFRRGVMALSAAYASQAMASREVECEAPWDPGRG